MSATLTRAAARLPMLPIVGEADVDVFIASVPDRISVLLFRGDPLRFPDGDDIAVVLPQLIAAFSGRLVGAEIAAGDEAALMPRFGVKVCPAIALARPGRSLGATSKIQDWSVYLARINVLLDADARYLAQEQLA
ncbi:hydrogenase accessory protein [Rhodopseudomonas sp. HC1]|uniref:hydrogenase accessory protein n=1 Tax=Rhodopseudomonas infernalis TaxID=2897386 RepID=UPI001EE7AD81|nr:hydrogenase accessory protein [Rhodopseudomonas infernalis]MCG6207422.1 hydrogenase accessory protein [Rhodopseudomonas infernalis]